MSTATLDPTRHTDLGQPAARAVPTPVPVLLGTVTGLLGLVAMARLAAGAFTGAMATSAWVGVLVVMVPWVVFVAVRAHRARLSARRCTVVAALVLVGVVSVWLSVPGPVLSLVSSFAASVVIWVSGWPTRRAGGFERWVRIDELQHEDDDD